MKKFYEGGEHFVLSAYRIKAAPLDREDGAGERLAKTICEDACWLSAEGTGQTALELLRLAGKEPGGEIGHFLTIRTHDKGERGCVTRQEALVKGVLALLRQAGYEAEELPYDAYRARLASMTAAPAVWALARQDAREYGVQGTYRSPAAVEEVDWKRIYAALDGSGCGLCVQLIPTLLTGRERAAAAQSAARCVQAAEGAAPGLRDSLATAAAERWKRVAGESARPFAQVNILVAGERADAALVTARVRQAVGEPTFRAVDLPQYAACPVYNQPWELALALRRRGETAFEKWTAEEAAKIFRPPVQGDYFIGLPANGFSLLPETDLLPEALTRPAGGGVRLGRSVFSHRDIFLPLEQLLLHTAVLGKSGVGKTTLLKEMIAQLRRRGVPVLILEPVKREYRDLAAGMAGSRVFTVERPVTPLLINPFAVPRGVPLGEYRSSLLSAFKAAFSLPDPLPALFEKAISEAYARHGWTDGSRSGDKDVSAFDMADFIRVFKGVIARSTYSGEVKGNMMSGGAFRLQSLVERCPRTFDTLRSTPVEDLLRGCAVLEMGSLEPEQKSLVSALTLISVLAYLKATRASGHGLRNVILIDEAHALLDQGEGATQEEKALNSAMTQLMINVITEIRAYGVGVVFSDQSPSRVGGRMLDNVDNILSFRLSGEEAQALRTHMGEGEELCRVLPLLAPGELVVKNRFLRAALPVRMARAPGEAARPPVTDAQLARAQAGYLAARKKDYRPYRACAGAGCQGCAAAARDAAGQQAARLFAREQPRLRAPEGVAELVLRLPALLPPCPAAGVPFDRWCRCVAVHLLRVCAMETGVAFGEAAVERLLSEMSQRNKEGRSGHE